MFDANNPAHLAALKAEVEIDPIPIGYAAVIDVTAQLLKLLNDPANNVGGETGGIALTVANFLDALVPADLGHASVNDGSRAFVSSFLRRDLNFNIERWRAKITAVFQTTSATTAALNDMDRLISRGEVLFGIDTVITRNDWIAARNS